MTDLLQAVILRSPRVSVAVNGDLHGGCFAHDTVCHRLAICNTSPETNKSARRDGVAFFFFFLQWPRNPVAAACLLAYTDANVALLTLTVGADVAGWMGPDNPASFTKQRA